MALQSAAAKVIESGWFIQGQNVKVFEKEFAEFCGTSYCIGVGNGLDAITIIFKAWIELGLLALGDEVLVPSNTYIASVLAISASGLVPVLVEPCENTYNVPSEAIIDKISSKTKCIMAVHLYGRLAPIEQYCRIARDHNLLIIEDCAQAHGARINNKSAGSWGDASAFSFYPGKNLGALGDAGAIVTNNQALYSMAKKIGNYGSTRKYHHEVKGVNSRLDEIQAAFLTIKLHSLNKDNRVRQNIAKRYINEISNIYLKLPEITQELTDHVWHLFVIRVSNRKSFQEYMLIKGIETQIHYPMSMNSHNAYPELMCSNCPVSTMLAQEIVSIPLNPSLTEVEVNYIIDVVNEFK